MNKQNRFLIASKLSEHRDTEGAIKAFNEATHNANGQNIQEIHTDAWRAYRERISKNFANVGHIAMWNISARLS